MLDKKQTILNLDELKKEYKVLYGLQKMYDKELDIKLNNYRKEKNLHDNYIPGEQEWVENIGDNTYPDWYQEGDKRKLEIYQVVTNKIEELTGIKINNAYGRSTMFDKWLEIPFCKK